MTAEDYTKEVKIRAERIINELKTLSEDMKEHGDQVRAMDLDEEEPLAAAIVRQAIPRIRRKMDQVERLLDIRAYRDAERVLRDAERFALELALRLKEGI